MLPLTRDVVLTGVFQKLSVFVETFCTNVRVLKRLCLGSCGLNLCNMEFLSIVDAIMDLEDER